MIKKYNNLQEWLESGEAEDYNLIADTQDEQDEVFGMIENPYEKFFVYKYITEFQNDSIWEKLEEIKKSFEEKAYMYKSINDPDSYSKSLQEVYKLLWKNVAKQPFMRQEPRTKKMKEIWEDGKKSASDAMTSVQGILKVALQNIINDKKQTKPENMCKEIFEHIQKMMTGAFNENKEYWTKKFCVVVAADLSAEKLDESFYELIDKYYPDNILSEFINRCFTIGNYCPVPVGFNAARARDEKENKNYDYWDLTLMKIKDWYDTRDDSLLKEQLLHKNGNLKNCKKWLEWFEKKENKVGKTDGWHNFVDTLLMQDYVNEKYEVMPFWEGHTWGNPELPKDDEKIKEALKGISKRIKARSQRIVEKMKLIKIECH